MKDDPYLDWLLKNPNELKAAQDAIRRQQAQAGQVEQQVKPEGSLTSGLGAPKANPDSWGEVGKSVGKSVSGFSESFVQGAEKVGGLIGGTLGRVREFGDYLGIPGAK